MHRVGFEPMSLVTCTVHSVYLFRHRVIQSRKTTFPLLLHMVDELCSNPVFNELSALYTGQLNICGVLLRQILCSHYPQAHHTQKGVPQP